MNPPQHRAEILSNVFNREFRAENTLLLPHVDAWKTAASLPAVEPVYLPAGAECPHHRIVFAHGFFASALHEVAHWCVAGKLRRELVDYGYWYQPDGRDAKQQAEFESVEARPQALEWAFSMACRFPFRVSTDNLDGVTPDREAFTAKVRAELQRYIDNGFPDRAHRFIAALEECFGTRNA